MTRHVIEAPDGSRHVVDDGQAAQDLEWSDVPGQAIQNLPSSAANLASNIVQPILHPIDTANAIKDIGAGAVSKAAGALGFEQNHAEKDQSEAAINAVGDFFSKRYGSMDGFKKTLAEDPLGFVADVSTVLTGGGALAARGPGVIGQVGRAVANAGSKIEPITATARAVAGGVGKAGAHVLGMTSGAGAEPIKQAYRAGRDGSQVFVDNMRGRAPMSDALDMAKSGVRQMGKERGDAYRTDMAGIKANKRPLDFGPIGRSLVDAKKIAYFEDTMSISDDASKTYLKIADKVKSWRTSMAPTGTGGVINNFRTAEGFDALKKAINEVRQETRQGTQARLIADTVYNTIKDEITKQVPEYASVMKDYSQASDQIDDVTRTFSLGERAAPDTALRKLQSVMRNNVNTNYGSRTRLMDELAQYEPDLPNALAGQALNSATPRGLAMLPAGGAALSGISSINPATLAVLPAASPRIVGEAAHLTGRAAGAAKRAKVKTGLSPEMIAKALLLLEQTGQATGPLRGSQAGNYPNE